MFITKALYHKVYVTCIAYIVLETLWVWDGFSRVKNENKKSNLLVLFIQKILMSILMMKKSMMADNHFLWRILGRQS